MPLVDLFTLLLRVKLYLIFQILLALLKFSDVLLVCSVAVVFIFVFFLSNLRKDLFSFRLVGLIVRLSLFFQFAFFFFALLQFLLFFLEVAF